MEVRKEMILLYQTFCYYNKKHSTLQSNVIFVHPIRLKEKDNHAEQVSFMCKILYQNEIDPF